MQLARSIAITIRALSRSIDSSTARGQPRVTGRGLYYGRESTMSAQPAGRVPALAAAARAVARCVSRHPGIQAAYIFGSVAQGRARPDSDLDIAVLLDRPIPDARALRYRLKLAGDLGAALHRNDVQLVILNDAPPLLAHRVLSRGVLVFERARVARVRFHVETARRYEDMVPTMERYVDRLKQDVREGRPPTASPSSTCWPARKWSPRRCRSSSRPWPGFATSWFTSTWRSTGTGSTGH